MSALARAFRAMDLFGRRWHFDGNGAGGGTDPPLHTHTRRQGADVAGIEPLGLAGGYIEMSDFAFQHDFVLGDLLMPVTHAVVAGLVVAEDQFQPLVAHE